MADWLVRDNKQYIPRMSPSGMSERFGVSFVDGEGNAQSNATAIYQPDLTAVQGFNNKFWLVNDDVISLMSPGERQTVLDNELEAQKDRIAGNLEPVLKGFIKALNNGAFVPDSNYTPQQIKAIIKAAL